MISHPVKSNKLNLPLTFLTIDQDWAPDWQLEQVLGSHVDKELTFFATSLSPWVKDVALKCPKWTVGIHPNFEANSTHGRNPSEVLNSLLEDFPDSRIWRAHSLLQSNRVHEALIQYPNLIASSNLYDSNHSLVFPLNIDKYANYIEFPICWEDDVILRRLGKNQLCNKESKFHCLNFHVQHIITNAVTLKDYESQRNIIYSQENKAPFKNGRGSGGIADLFEIVMNGPDRLLSFDTYLNLEKEISI